MLLYFLHSTMVYFSFVTVSQKQISLDPVEPIRFYCSNHLVTPCLIYLRAMNKKGKCIGRERREKAGETEGGRKGSTE